MKYSSILLLAFLLSSCGRSPSVTMQNGTGSSQPASAVSLPADPQHGELTYLAIGALAGEGKTLASGTAVLWMFADGTSRASIQLNIAEADGKAYVVWLQGADGLKTKKLGTLQNMRGDVRHSFTLEAKDDYKQYANVVITREPSEGVSTPGQVVAKGILKETAR